MARPLKPAAAPEATSEALQGYLAGPFANIKGWCQARLWDCVAPLAEIVRARGDTGPVAEIGVQNGKFLIGLIKAAGTPGPHLAIDIFGLPHFGADVSNQSERDVLEANLAACDVAIKDVEIREADSLWLSDTDALAALDRTGGYSFFSIDGSRAATHVIHDLGFASRVMRPTGVIFIDDYYNPNWPGVHEGVAKWFFLNPAAKFVPLLYTVNKLVLCSLSWHAHYLYELHSYLKERPDLATVKRVKRFGFDSLTAHPRAR